MHSKDYSIIGIDGGATKVSGWIINYSNKTKSYTLSNHHAELPYSSIEGHIPDFQPIPIPDQLSQRDSGKIDLTHEELTQASVYVKAAANIIYTLASLGGNKPVLIGMGMPGLKTANLRGINVIANGPRIINYCDHLEKHLIAAGIISIAPIARLGSDADYCGFGEFYAKEGSFRNVNNAYYLGGGTGAADALILKGQLIPFDQVKPWLAKTWEMKNDLDLSLEKYASASGLQFIYSKYANKTVESLNASNIFPPQIASLAVKKNVAALKTFDEVAQNLSMLIFERISTVFCGSKDIFKFVNPNRQKLDTVHLYRGEIFDRIVIGQRLGDLMASSEGKKVLTSTLLERLSSIIRSADCLPQKAKKNYLQANAFRREKLIFSRLREAPALGAGIDAHLCLNRT
jgi:hypothetical protein